MAVIVVACVSGAPGASTLAAGLAVCWPPGSALLVEADPHGGVLAARFGARFSPGTTTAAAAARHGGDWDLAAHAQRLALGAGVDAVVAPASADVAAAALTGLAHTDLAATGRVVVADVGRLAPAHPAAWLIEAADTLLLVAWPRLDCLAQATHQLRGLPEPVRARTRLVLRAARASYKAAHVGADLDVEVASVLPHDPWGAAVLAGRAGGGRTWRRLALARETARLAATLTATPPPPATSPAPAHTESREHRTALPAEPERTPRP